MAPLLTVEHLTIEAFDDGRWKPIVNDISLTLERGEVLGLIGESGAGKSTIGLAAMGYTRPGCRLVSGSIVFDGIEVTGLSEQARRQLRGTRIAYVAQSAAASFNPAHQLIKQFAEAPVQHGLMSFSEAEKRAVELYRQLELPEPERIGYRYPHQVSGGQLQRAMVAMALAGRPDLIVFDEPTTALDVTTQIEVLAAIKHVIEQLNTAAIYISHDLAVVAQVADRMMVLRYGNLIEEGPTRELLERAEQDYTRRLLSVRTLRGEKEQAGRYTDVVLEVERVSACYRKGVKVIDDVSLRIRRGRTVAVVGESGSGKTTLARVITGLLPALEGRIVFAGEEMPSHLRLRNRESLRRLQMIYQMPDTALNPRQKVRKILGRPLEFYFGIKGSQKEERIGELLDMVELSEKYIDRYPPELSGGEKQRLCLARALAANPDLIICDEVTSALDALVAEEVLKLLQRLQDELGVSYLFITHDLATVKAIADEMVVMLRGRIVEQGSKREVLTPPHHEYTGLLLSSVPEMDPDWLDSLLEAREARREPISP
ncbi:MAG: ABC transporter ATP-binding protein [Deltaproteobacteria bacterium]|nr:ABC transporter ATP-binding protein [Deltaproteobacteria bacterium]MBW2122565.1 ABC transporter ATP-binding protein [Deltaproteobacteria bacterium]